MARSLIIYYCDKIYYFIKDRDTKIEIRDQNLGTESRLN